MELWFDNALSNFPQPPAPLRRSISEESGYISADSDMVIDTFKSCKFHKHDIFENLDAAEKSNFSWCRVKQFMLEKSLSVEQDQSTLKYDLDEFTTQQEKDFSQNRIMNEPTDIISNPQLQPDVSTTRGNDDQSRASQSSDSNPKPSTSKKNSTPEETNILPSGMSIHFDSF